MYYLFFNSPAAIKTPLYAASTIVEVRKRAIKILHHFEGAKEYSMKITTDKVGKHLVETLHYDKSFKGTVSIKKGSWREVIEDGSSEQGMLVGIYPYKPPKKIKKKTYRWYK